MRYDVRFKGIEYSRSLIEFVEEKFARLEKLEIRPTLVHVTFSSARHLHQADVYIKGFQKPLRARGIGESFLEALDVVVDKVRRQMAKEKAIVKRHKNYKKSAFGQLKQRLKLPKEWDEAA